MRKTFPDRWRTIALWIFTGMQGIMGIIHLTFGSVARDWGIALAYKIPVIGLLGTIALTALAHRKRLL
jgi:hypothetical protein